MTDQKSCKCGIVTTLVALALSATFFYAGGEKIISPVGFAIDLQNYRLLPQWAVNGVALMFPWWEVLAAFAILVPSWRRAAAIMIVLMGLVFFLSVSYALYHGYDITCGCFGHGEHASKAGLKTLAIDVAVMIGGTFVARQAGLVQSEQAFAAPPSDNAVPAH